MTSTGRLDTLVLAEPRPEKMAAADLTTGARASLAGRVVVMKTMGAGWRVHGCSSLLTASRWLGVVVVVYTKQAAVSGMLDASARLCIIAFEGDAHHLGSEMSRALSIECGRYPCSGPTTLVHDTGVLPIRIVPDCISGAARSPFAPVGCLILR